MLLYFLQPILLWAAAGIIVPVVIHLWNIRQGKTLKVGSIALIAESDRSQARSFKITQWLLLLLRCLLLIVLAILIAQPYWLKPFHTKEQGWIMIEKSGFNKAYYTYQPLIDSLQKNNFTLHYFDETFKEVNLKDTLAIAQDTLPASGLSYWALLKILNEKIPANLPVYVFTDHLLQHFYGNRPEVPLNVKWYTYSSGDTTATWLASAYATATDSIRTVVGKSSSAGTFYTWQNLPTNGVQGGYNVSSKEGKLFVSSNDAKETMAADTATMVIAIYTNKYSADANYVKAAVEAIKDFTQRKIQVTVVNSIANIPPNYNWLFWLSEDDIPASQVKNNVLVYENGKAQSVHSTLLTADNAALTTTGRVALYQYIKNDAFAYQPVWTNGLDEPVLSRQKNGAVIYHFYARFNPQWSDLVWSPSFPQILYHLLYEEDNIGSETMVQDKRIMDASQVQPVRIAAQQVDNKAIAQDKKDVSSIFWLVAFCVFLLERVVSFKQTKSGYA